MWVADDSGRVHTDMELAYMMALSACVEVVAA